MKKLRVQIYAYKYHADFIIESEDSPEAVENAIIDKLGENDIKWEYLGEMNDPRINRITYEEVIDGANANTSERPLYEEKRSGPRMGAGAS
jgi:hypothetical protein